jgi:hypothetical protein
LMHRSLAPPSRCPWTYRRAPSPRDGRWWRSPKRFRHRR